MNTVVTRMKAKFTPRNVADIPGKLVDRVGQTYEWTFAFALDSGELYYETVDLGFGSSEPFSINDLTLIEKGFVK